MSDSLKSNNVPSIYESIKLYQVRNSTELEQLTRWIKEMPYRLTIPDYLCPEYEENDYDNPIRDIRATYLSGSWGDEIDFCLEFDLFGERFSSPFYAQLNRKRKQFGKDSLEYESRRRSLDRRVLKDMIQPDLELAKPLRNYFNGIKSIFNVNCRSINVMFTMATDTTFPDTN